MDQNENKISGDSGKQLSPLTSSSGGKTASYEHTPAEAENSIRSDSVGSVLPELPSQFGRYRVVEKLGDGGMGSVYLVENTTLEREEALKVPLFSDGDDPEVRERFVREAKSAAKIDHSNVCPIYDAGAQDGNYYLTMRYLKGKLLSEYTGRAQPNRKSVEIVIRLAQAMEAAHSKGIIHRDLKPKNIMMVSGVGPVVMDFGLAKLIRQPDQKLTQTGSSLGTPAYMPPEQIRGDLEQMGPASDVYSLGVILFQLLTGRLPFDGPTVAVVYGQILHTEPPMPSSLLPALSPVLDDICSRAMAKEPAARYPSMKAFAAELTEYLRSIPLTAGASNLAPTAVDNAAVFQAATIPPGARVRENDRNFQPPKVPPKPRHERSNAGATEASRPAPKSSKMRSLITGVGVLLSIAVVLIGIFAVGWFRQEADNAAHRRRMANVSRENFDRLNVGMTRSEMESILGPGEPTVPQDAVTFEVGYFKCAPRTTNWLNAMKKRKVLIWRGLQGDWGKAIHPSILAAFPDDPSSTSQAIAFLRLDAHDDGQFDQKPADRWMVTKENFLKLKVGMTLQELEDIIGGGEPAKFLPGPMTSLSSSTSRKDWTDAVTERWLTAVNEYRVYQWKGKDWTSTGEHNLIVAGFSEPPSAAASTKVKALSYRDGRWDEDKGDLALDTTSATSNMNPVQGTPVAQPEQGQGEVMVEWAGKWYSAAILKTENGKSLVHYDGWDSKWDEWVSPDRIRKKVSGELE